ncbi:zinc finger CCCH domain-containing protein [Aspergillus mulundensis]|uniref:C3H1-type domain-containing protein n=1 Tax=Aspergillus mulundensis TaxID=1810919 RepID=A0A3D8R4Q7_9EURO|nr:hypothetical protein DSM5745_08710 [Aspergillus mulundensis]RDW68950.1 hypothetical protein DSM5745_08710 [Aspergillus mulundensis]
MSRKAEISSLNARLKAIEENDLRRREENDRIRREEIYELLGQLHILLDDSENKPEKCDLKDEVPTKHKQLSNSDDLDLGDVLRSVTAQDSVSSRKAPRICRFYKVGNCRFGSGCRNIHTMPLREISSASSYYTSQARSTITKQTSTSVPREHNFAALLPTKDPRLRDSIPVNKYGERVDPYVEKPAEAIWEPYIRQVKRIRLCNAYYLTGRCTAKECNYYHGRLKFDPVDAIRYQLKTERCNKRARCRRLDCLYGHHCQSLSCDGAKLCRFDQYTHTQDLKVVRWETPDGRTAPDELQENRVLPDTSGLNIPDGLLILP